jgi:hypothetical protein
MSDQNLSSPSSEASFHDARLHGVGLSDPQLADQRWRMFDLIRRLRNTGCVVFPTPMLSKLIQRA